jgi:hypothetical protein
MVSPQILSAIKTINQVSTFLPIVFVLTLKNIDWTPTRLMILYSAFCFTSILQFVVLGYIYMFKCALCFLSYTLSFLQNQSESRPDTNHCSFYFRVFLRHDPFHFLTFLTSFLFSPVTANLRLKLSKNMIPLSLSKQLFRIDYFILYSFSVS